MGKKPKKPKRKPSAYNKHIGREMRAGKTMKQAAASWKKKGSKPKSGGSSRSSSTTRRSNTTAKRGGFNTQKLFKGIRMVALIAPLAKVALGTGTGEQKLNTGIAIMTGYDLNTGDFQMHRLAKGWGPYVVATVMTTIVPKITSFIRGIV